MTNGSATTYQGQPAPIYSRNWQAIDYQAIDCNDDDDEADGDDFDDDDKAISPSREISLSRTDFGSPEWWSRT